MRVPSIVSQPGVYRKLIVYIGMAILVLLNEFFGFGIEEDLYTDKLKQAADILILVVGGFFVERLGNDKPREQA